MGGRRLLLPTALAALAAGTSGCEDCGPWDGLEVTDPDGVASEDAFEAVESGIDRFADWTGRTETCVEEVRLVEEVGFWGRSWSGRYNGVLHRILLDADRVGTLASTTVHEFCHALDHEEGWPSEDGADLLAPYAERVDEDLYPSETARTHEAFANLCEAGPALPALWRQLERACGVDLADDAVEYVHGIAFQASDLDLGVGTFGAASKWASVEGTERSGMLVTYTAVAGRGGIYVLAVVVPDDGTAVARPEVLRVDPGSLRVEETLALEPYDVPLTDVNGNPSYSMYSLLGSSGDPILYRYRSDEAWRVRTDPLRLEPMDFPRLPDGWIGGFEHEGVVLAHASNAKEEAVLRIDLATGTWRHVAEGETERFRADMPVSLFADERGGVALFEGSGLSVAGIGWDGEVEWLHVLPGAYGLGQPVVRHVDGTVLFFAYVYGGEEGGVVVRHLLPVRLDPATGAWSAPEGDCEDIPIGLPALTADGATVQVSWRGLDADTGCMWLGRLEVTD